VHGVVTLLSFDLSGGGVHALMPQRLRCMRDEGAPLSWQRVAKHGQSGRLGEATAGHRGLARLHLKAWGCSPHPPGEAPHLISHREAVAFPPEAAQVADSAAFVRPYAIQVSKHSLRRDLVETAAQCEQCEDPAHLFQPPPSGTMRTVEADPPPPPPMAPMATMAPMAPMAPPMAPAAATTDSETSTTGGGGAAAAAAATARGGGGGGASHRRSAIEEEAAACGASLRPATGGRLSCGSLAASSADAASARVTALADGV